MNTVTREEQTLDPATANVVVEDRIDKQARRIRSGEKMVSSSLLIVSIKNPNNLGLGGMPRLHIITLYYCHGFGGRFLYLVRRLSGGLQSTSTLLLGSFGLPHTIFLFHEFTSACLLMYSSASLS